MEERELILCPFCGYKANGDYEIMVHMENEHPEDGESSFFPKDQASIAGLISFEDEENFEEYTNCPVEGCGEVLLLAELESHVEMHEEEQGSEEDSDHSSKRIKLTPKAEHPSFGTKLSHALRNLDDGENSKSKAELPAHDPQASAKAVWKNILKMPEASKTKIKSTSKSGARRRLGKSELGPYAHEKEMPVWLVKLLKKEDGVARTTNHYNRHGALLKTDIRCNMEAGMIPVLHQLLEQDSTVKYAYLCDPAVKHVSKLAREGGFCGYRNIQMLSSYIIGRESQGHENFKRKVPSIFEIQDYIENAWDFGINSQGRDETGGIRGTRKYIGTPDAQAMFVSLGIACNAQGIKPKKGDEPAFQLLFRAVENYFNDSCTDYNPKVRCISLPPIYFQHPGHSMTIVGFERRADGAKNLIVFDPMFHDSPPVTKLIEQKFRHSDPGNMLRAYRRGEKYLKRYKEFELLSLTPPEPPALANTNLDNESFGA